MQPIEIHDTTHMSTFVHQFYMSNMQQMKASYKEHMKDYFDARQVRHLFVQVKLDSERPFPPACLIFFGAAGEGGGGIKKH